MRGTGLFAQSTSAGWIAAPFAGLLADQELTEVRAIQGVPGSSTVGGPIALPASVLRVHLAPAQAWALVEQAPSRTLGLMPFNGTQPGGVIAIGNAMSAPDIVSFSPGGRSAVAVSYRLATMQVFTGLDSAPQMTMQTAISGLGDIGSVAVSDDGTLTAALMSDGRVLLLSATRTPQQIFQAGSPAGIGFLPNQAAVAIADGGAATVSVIDGLNGVPFTRLTMPGPSLSARCCPGAVIPRRSVRIPGGPRRRFRLSDRLGESDHAVHASSRKIFGARTATRRRCLSVLCEPGRSRMAVAVQRNEP